MDPSDSGVSYSSYSSYSDNSGYSSYSHYSDNTVIHDRPSEDKTADYVNYETIGYLDNKASSDQSLEHKPSVHFNYGTINYFNNHTEIKENNDKSFYATRKFANDFDECCYNRTGCVDATRAASWIGYCTLMGFGAGAVASSPFWGYGLYVHALGAEGFGILLTTLGGVATCGTTLAGTSAGYSNYLSGRP